MAFCKRKAGTGSSFEGVWGANYRHLGPCASTPLRTSGQNRRYCRHFFCDFMKIFGILCAPPPASSNSTLVFEKTSNITRQKRHMCPKTSYFTVGALFFSLRIENLSNSRRKCTFSDSQKCTLFTVGARLSQKSTLACKRRASFEKMDQTITNRSIFTVGARFFFKTIGFLRSEMASELTCFYVQNVR